MYSVRLKGEFDLAERDVVRFHPWVEDLLKEIREKGWKPRVTKVEAEVLVELDLDSLSLRLSYHPPRLGELDEEKGVYEISAELGGEPPAVVKIISVDRFLIDISTDNCFKAAEIDPFENKVTSLRDVLWNFSIGRDEVPERLSEAREVYEVARWLFEEKKFKPGSKYVVEKYKTLIDLFEKPYSFSVTVELTIGDESRVPGWDELREELVRFFYDRGLLARVKEEGDEFPFRKPIP